MTSALSGLRVLDFTTTIAGPHCTRLLADLGAEVIKIEAPEGDMMRSRPPLRDGASTSFGQLNTGKKSVVLDLKRPAAVEAARRLVATADVVVENFRPGVMQRFGLDYAALKAVKPDLVYCAISGYGQTGPSAGLPAYAPVIHASSGYDLAQIAYQGGARRPDYCGIYIADVLTGTYAFGAIMTALYQRQATGEGQLIDVSMLESMLSLTLSEIQLRSSRWRRPGGRSSARSRPRTAISICRSPASARFQNLARGRGRPDWITDPRFAKYPDRRANWGDLDRRAGSLVERAHDRRGAGDLRSPRRAGLALSHGQGGDGRPAARASPRLRRGARRTAARFRALNPPFRLLRRTRRRAALRRRARRAHRGDPRRTRLHPDRNYGLPRLARQDIVVSKRIRRSPSPTRIRARAGTSARDRAPSPGRRCCWAAAAP